MNRPTQSLLKKPLSQPKTTPKLSTQSKESLTPSTPQNSIPSNQPSNNSKPSNSSNDKVSYPIEPTIINTLSLLLTSFLEQMQSNSLPAHLLPTLCPQEKSSLADMLKQQRQMNKFQNKSTNNNNNNNNNNISPLLDLLKLRSEPITENPIINTNPIHNSKSNTSNSSQSNFGDSNSNPKSSNRNNNNSNQRTNNKAPQNLTPVKNQSISSPNTNNSTSSNNSTSTSSSSTTNTPTYDQSIYITTPLQQRDPILLYHCTQLLHQFTTESTMLSYMIHKYRSQLRRQTYFSWVRRLVGKTHVVQNSLLTFLSSLYTLIYSYYDAIQADSVAQKLQRAKMGQNTSKTATTTTNTIPNLFGSEYTDIIYQGLCTTYFELSFPTQISTILTSLLSLYLTCIKTIPQLTQMIHATYLLPFCYTATSITAKLIQIIRSLLLLFYPLYLSSTSLPQQQQQQQQSPQQQLSSTILSPTSSSLLQHNITSQQIWHFLFRFQLDLQFLNTVSFQPVLSSLSTTHIYNNLQLTAEHGDILPPQIPSKHPITTFPTYIPIKSSDNNTNNNIPIQDTNQSNQQLINNKNKKQKLSNRDLATTTTTTSNNTTPNPNSSSNFIPIATHYANYLKATKSNLDQSTITTILMKNPLYSIPFSKLPQLELQFKSLIINSTSNSSSNNTAKISQHHHKPIAFTSKLQETFFALIQQPFRQYESPLLQQSSSSSSSSLSYNPHQDKQFSYLQAQEVLLYLFATDSNPHSPLKSFELQNEINQTSFIHKTIYDYDKNNIISTDATKTTFSYHWYLFSTSLLIYHNNQHNNSTINQNIYSHLDWVQNTIDLVQTKVIDDIDQKDSSNHRKVNATNNCVSILSRIEARLPSRRHKPITTTNHIINQSTISPTIPSKISHKLPTAFGIAAASSDDDCNPTPQQQLTFSRPITMNDDSDNNDDNQNTVTGDASTTSVNDFLSSKSKNKQIINKPTSTTNQQSIKNKLQQQRNEQYKKQNQIENDNNDEEEVQPQPQQQMVKKQKVQLSKSSNTTSPTSLPPPSVKSTPSQQPPSIDSSSTTAQSKLSKLAQYKQSKVDLATQNKAQVGLFTKLTQSKPSQQQPISNNPFEATMSNPKSTSMGTKIGKSSPSDKNNISTIKTTKDKSRSSLDDLFSKFK